MTPTKDRLTGTTEIAPEPHEWADWPDERLLDLRLCDLKLTIEGSWLQERIDALHAELDAKGIGFRRTSGCRTSGSRRTA